MPLLLAIKFAREIAIVILIAFLLFAVSSCRTQNTAIKHIKTEHELTLVTMEAAYTAQALDLERKNNEQVIQAINDGQAREAAIALDVANTNSANDRLHQTVDRLNTSIARENSATRADYADTLSVILKESTARYIELAEKADGHVNDVRILQEINQRK